MKKNKRPYRKPVVRTEKVYERKSLASGKNAPKASLCIRNLKVS
jgi:hypothetical protein